MFAVIFTVLPKQDRWDEYLSLAKLLRPEIEKIDGFIDNERFRSRQDKARVLSLSTWRDEKAVIRWRTLGAHHLVQEKGRFQVFEDYHLRVGEIVADTHVPAGHAIRQQRLDATETGTATFCTITELAPGADGKPVSADTSAACGVPPIGSDGRVDFDTFESIYSPGKLLLLLAWRTESAAAAWSPRQPSPVELRHRRVRIIRDYSMRDRREAPQWYPDVADTVSAERKDTASEGGSSL